MEIMPFLQFILAILLLYLLIKTFFVIRNLILTIATPYNAAESIYWLFKGVTGLSRKNAGIVKSIPNSHILNQEVKPKYKLAFVGDIMPTGKSFINAGSELKEFLNDCDYLIGNFEGVITEWRKEALTLVSDRRHEKEIVTMLSNLFPPEKTYLSVSNNHAGDFGKDKFFESLKLLESGNFNLFGWNQRPFVDINDQIRITSGTMWSNRKTDYVFMLKNSEEQIKQGGFNFLYPHFGYEFELFPRPKMVETAKKSIEKFDALIAHHSHCPQPVTTESVKGINKLIAYSLGNFFAARKTEKYRYGIVLKVELGEDRDKRWLLGRVEWRLIKCNPLPNGDFTINLSNDRLFLDKST